MTSKKNDKHVNFFDLYAKGHFNHLKTLVRASTNKNPQDPNDLLQRETLLHKAVSDGKLEFVQFLDPLLSDKDLLL